MSCKRTYANPRSKGGNPLGKCPSTTSCTTHHFGYTDASSCTNNHYLTVTAGDTENPQDSNNPPQKIYYNRNDRLHFYGDTNIEVTVVDEEGNIQQSRTIGDEPQSSQPRLFFNSGGATKRIFFRSTAVVSESETTELLPSTLIADNQGQMRVFVNGGDPLPPQNVGFELKERMLNRGNLIVGGSDNLSTCLPPSTEGSILYINETSPELVDWLPPSSQGSILRMGSTVPEWLPPTPGILYNNGTTTWLANGSNNQYLTMNGGQPQWTNQLVQVSRKASIVGGPIFSVGTTNVIINLPYTNQNDPNNFGQYLATPVGTIIQFYNMNNVDSLLPVNSGSYVTISNNNEVSSNTSTQGQNAQVNLTVSSGTYGVRLIEPNKLPGEELTFQIN